MKPIVVPASETGRGAAAMPAAFISLVGSSTRIMMVGLSRSPAQRNPGSTSWQEPAIRQRASLHVPTQLHQRPIERIDPDEPQSRMLDIEDDIGHDRDDRREADDVKP